MLLWHIIKVFYKMDTIYPFYKVHPEVSSHVIWKMETFIEQYTRYKKHCTQDNDASVPFKVGTLGPHTGFSVALPLFKTLKIVCWNCHQLPPYFPESHPWSEISSLSKVILVLEKARSHRAPNLGCGVGGSHLGDLMFHQKALQEMWCMSGCVVVMKLPITSFP